MHLKQYLSMLYIKIKLLKVSNSYMSNSNGNSISISK